MIKEPVDVGIILFVALIYLATPVAMILGWIEWAKASRSFALFPNLSLAGFGLATASGLLAASTIIYSITTGGFAYYDPILLRIYRWGLLVSFVGFVFGIAGIWKPSPSRWFAPACSMGMLVFWVVMASGE